LLAACGGSGAKPRTVANADTTGGAVPPPLFAALFVDGKSFTYAVTTDTSHWDDTDPAADANGNVRLYMPFPVASGSSGSHYDTIASRNQLMEPAINADLTHSVLVPQDLTYKLLQEIGW